MMINSNFKTKCVSLILAIALLITMMPVTAFAVETTETEAVSSGIKSFSIDKTSLIEGDVATITMETEGEWYPWFVSYYKPITNNSKTFSFSNLSENIYTATIAVDNETESGLWQVRSVAFRNSDWDAEHVHNSKNEDSLSFDKADFSALDFEVSGTNADVTPPVLKSYSIDKEKVEIGKNVEISLVIEEENPVNQFSMVYLTPAKDEKRVYLTIKEKRSSTVTYTGIINITDESTSGLWQPDVILLTDVNENTAYVYNSHMNSYGWILEDLSGLNFEVIHAHKYKDEWTVDVEPTCTTEGSKSHHCIICGEKTDVTVIGVLAHDYSTEWMVDIEPTCSEEGSKSHHCTKCEAKTDVTSIPANDHTYGKWIVDTEATCTTKGSQHKTCACGDIITEEIPSLKHDYSAEWTVDVEPTCSEKGSKSHHCIRCNEKSNVTEIQPLAHNTIIKNKKDATCEEQGYTGDEFCTNCGVAVTYGKSIAALEHTEVKDKAVNATCTTTGLTEGSRCSVCNKILVEQEEISALGHKYGSTLTQKATVSKNGEIYKKCSVCNATEMVSTIFYPKTIKLSATKYTYNGKLKKPTVTVKDSNGKTIATSNYTVTYPKGMKNIGKYTVTVKFKGSKYSGTQKLTYTIVPKTTKVKSVTTILSGKTTVKWNTISGVTGYQLRYSTNSDMSSCKTKTYSGKNKNSAKLTGLTSGTKYYIQIRTYKTVSGTKYYSNWSNQITAKAPVFSLNKSTIQKGTTCYIALSNIKSSDTVKSWKSSNTSVATIKKVSKTKYKVTPKKCGITTISVKVNGATVKYKVNVSHKKVTVKGKAATCTSTGLTTGSKCSVCGKVLEAQKKIAAKGHNYSTEWTIDVKPTCTEKGSKSHHCTICEEKTGIMTIPANGHTVVIDAAVAPTTTATGLSEGSHCSVCGKVIVPQEVIPKLSPAEASSVECYIVDSYKTWKSGTSFREYIEYAVELVAIEKENMTNGKFKTTITVNLIVLNKTSNAPDSIKGEWLFTSGGKTAGGGMYYASNVEEGEIRQVTFTNYSMSPGDYRVTFSSYNN